MRIEREFFERCRDAGQSAAMRHLFFAEREVAKIPDVPKDTVVRDIELVAVIGAGTMGAGIALACLNSGFSVQLMDSSFDGLERGRQTIEKQLRDAVTKGRITKDQAKDRLSRLALVSDYKDIGNAQLVIEAVFESMAVKEQVFASLDRHCRKGAILATNTSTLDVDRIAAATDRPEDVIGLHFFSPANIMKLLEIVRGKKTSADVIASSMKFARVIGKIGVLDGYGRENQLMLLEGAAPEYIDKTLYDWGMAMGPNAVGDLAGLDIGHKVRQERSDLPDDPRFYRVADVLAEEGRYGQKSGRGMYLYKDESRTPTTDPNVTDMIRAEAAALGVEQRNIGPDEIIERCIYALIVEGARILDEGLALRASDIDVVWANGYGFPRYRGGPMFYADTVGLCKVYDAVCRFRDSYGGNELGDLYWKPPALLEELARDGGSFAGGNKS
jgi:3-hydroxyacyl-CoA dehydrogenase